MQNQGELNAFPLELMCLFEFSVIRNMEQATGNIIRISGCGREITEAREYEEVDPLPERRAEKGLPPQEAIPVPVESDPPHSIHMPGAAELTPKQFSSVELIAKVIEWSNWCAEVYSFHHPEA